MKITSEHIIQTSNHHLSNDCEAIFVVENESNKVEINVNWYIDGYSEFNNHVNIHVDDCNAVLEDATGHTVYNLDSVQAKDIFNALSEAVNDNPIENGLPHYIDSYKN